MTRSNLTTIPASAVVIPLTALVVGACGGGGAATAPTPRTSSGASATVGLATAPTPRTASAALATVGVGNSSLGAILVNSAGRTLYLFKADVRGHSACAGPCATAWPPLLATGKPTAGARLTGSKLATITRSDGDRQVTYNGHPLYLYIGDTHPGDVTGQGLTAFGAAWFALTPLGNQASGRASGSGGGTSSGGRSAY